MHRLKTLAETSLVHPQPFLVNIEKCHGMYIATYDRGDLFDWHGLYASKLVAYNHPRLYEPEYVKKLVYCANNKVPNSDFVTPEMLAYYDLLRELTPRVMKNAGQVKTFTLNSGAEAVENAMKFLLRVWYNKNSHTSMIPKFVTFEGGFHGRTVYALNATDMPHNRNATDGYHGLLATQNITVSFPAYDNDNLGDRERVTEEALCELRDVLRGEDIAGCVVEPCQGAGGHRCATDQFFQEMMHIAHDRDVPVMFDEVQTAGGQTGDVFMCDQLGLPYAPHAVATAKKFGCGVVYLLDPPENLAGVLDSTWSGTLVDMVRVVQEWKIVRDEGLVEVAGIKGYKLYRMLKSLQDEFPHVISNVRGRGLYMGFTVAPGLRNELVKKALEREKLLLFRAGVDSIRFRPHLNVTYDDVLLLHTMLRRLFVDM